MTLFLRQKDFIPLVSMADCIDALDDAFGRWSEPGNSVLPRSRIPAGDNLAHFMAAALPGGIFGYRCAYYAGRYNWLVLAQTGDPDPLAIMECGWLANVRTGGASGIATKYLAREDAKIHAVIGSGRQAASQVRAVSAVRPIEELRVYNRTEESREKFAAAMAEELDILVIAADSGEACVKGADIISTITNAAEPVLEGAWLSAGVHINGAGANAAQRRELDDAAVLAADLYVTDSVEQAQIEAGAFIDLVAAGKFSWDDVVELGAVVEGAAPRRTSDDQITFFHSLGLTFEDVVFAKLIYDRAIAAGIGAEFN